MKNPHKALDSYFRYVKDKEFKVAALGEKDKRCSKDLLQPQVSLPALLLSSAQTQAATGSESPGHQALLLKQKRQDQSCKMENKAGL